MSDDPAARPARSTGRATVRRTTRTVAVVAAAGTALAAGAIGLHARADGMNGGSSSDSTSPATQAAVPPQQSQNQFQGSSGFGSNAPSQGFGPPAGRSGGS